MKKILTLFAALMTVFTVNAGSYFLKNNWGGGAESWIELTDGGDGSYYADDPVTIGNKDLVINTEASDEGARVIKQENVSAFIAYDPAELSAGDQVFFIYAPDEYNAYDPKKTGLQGMIESKNGYALKAGKVWKNMTDDDGSFTLNDRFGGENVQLVTGNNIRTIKPASIATTLNFDDATLAKGDTALFIYVPDMYNSYNPEEESGMMAMINWKAGYALKADKVWKNMTDDDGSFTLNDGFGGENVQLVTGNNIRTIKPASIATTLNFDDATLAKGDTALFIYVPDMYNSYNPEEESGMSAMINWKAGYALKADKVWKNMTEDDGSFILNDGFGGENVQLVTGNNIRTIKPASIATTLNFDDATLANGDTALFIYVPDMYNSYNPEEESGMSAMINWKNGYALKADKVWKNMTEDEGSFILNDGFGGENVQLVTGNNIRTIKPENIATFINYDFATLSKGDSALFIFNPEDYNSYDETESGMSAMINWKNGYALKTDKVWKNMTEDDGSFVLNDGFGGENVQLVTGNNIRTIKPASIATTLNFDDATLAKGDTALFIYVPDMYNSYNPEEESGMSAMINWKAGYALKADKVWKNMTEDEGSFILNDGFGGENVQLVTGNNIRTIKPENIATFINYDFATLTKGDSALFIFNPEDYNSYDETESGMSAMIYFKAGYAFKVGNAWSEMAVDSEDDDWWSVEGIKFDGKDLQLAHANDIRTIKPESVTAFLDLDFAELAVGDEVIFVYRPSMYNSYDPENESGMQAIITNKAGYALKSAWEENEISWKNMTKQDEDTYILENVVFDGKDVALVNGINIRTIKVENIKAYLLPTYEDAVLEAGDLVTFMYTPSEYAAMDPAKSGLSALIIKKHEATGIENIQGINAQSTKFIINGQFIIEKNGKLFNALGQTVR